MKTCFPEVNDKFSQIAANGRFQITSLILSSVVVLLETNEK